MKLSSFFSKSFAVFAICIGVLVVSGAPVPENEFDINTLGEQLINIGSLKFTFHGILFTIASLLLCSTGLTPWCIALLVVYLLVSFSAAFIMFVGIVMEAWPFLQLIANEYKNHEYQYVSFEASEISPNLENFGVVRIESVNTTGLNTANHGVDFVWSFTLNPNKLLPPLDTINIDYDPSSIDLLNKMPVLFFTSYDAFQFILPLSTDLVSKEDLATSVFNPSIVEGANLNSIATMVPYVTFTMDANKLEIVNEFGTDFLKSDMNERSKIELPTNDGDYSVGDIKDKAKGIFCSTISSANDEKNSISGQWRFNGFGGIDRSCYL